MRPWLIKDKTENIQLPEKTTTSSGINAQVPIVGLTLTAFRTMFLATEYLSGMDSELSPTARHGKCSQERLRWNNSRLEDDTTFTDNI
ncbi:hypothetical protein GB937_006506 [Aspergillus fischeri]|nr:hypothetical protein GB937_006506 [Aspergillus fischeri]